MEVMKTPVRVRVRFGCGALASGHAIERRPARACTQGVTGSVPRHSGVLDALPPFFDASGEVAILAARCLDIPFSLSFSYCLAFYAFADLLGMLSLLCHDGTTLPPYPTLAKHPSKRIASMPGADAQGAIATPSARLPMPDLLDGPGASGMLLAEQPPG